MSCQKLFLPYVHWAVQEQSTDVNRYIVGITLVSTNPAGNVVFVRGYGDVTEAKVSRDGARFRVILRGKGQRLFASAREHLAKSDTDQQTPGYIAEQSIIDEQNRVIILVEANHKKVRVRVGDVDAQKVVDSVILNCEQNVFVGYAEDRTYILSLQYVERVNGGWQLVEEAGELTNVEIPEITLPDEDEAQDADEATTPDDLEKIEGIGSQIAGILNNLGIRTYAQLSLTEPDDLQNMLEEAGINTELHIPVFWPAQAALAVAGRWNALKYLQDQILDYGTPKLPDDLTQINGIGSAIAAKLDEIGIHTFKEIAETDPEHLEYHLRAEGARIPLGSTHSWPQQAALARDHKWIELEAYQKKLHEMDTQFQGGDTLEE